MMSSVYCVAVITTEAIMLHTNTAKHHSVFPGVGLIIKHTELNSSSSPFPQVAKDVSIRLHSQLDSVEKKRSRLDQENEELRVRLQDLEVAKQVLQQEIDKVGSQYHNCAVWRRPGDAIPGPAVVVLDLTNAVCQHGSCCRVSSNSRPIYRCAVC